MIVMLKILSALFLVVWLLRRRVQIGHAMLAGLMLSPAHLCLIVTGEYFKADIFKSLRPVLFLEGIIVAIVILTQFK
ncbi:MAG: DUF401 family protein [Desulfosporosinus sp.]|nr:DUF401 family protein [Desulfosporosinus sp.]